MTDKPKPDQDFTQFAKTYLDIASKSALPNYKDLIQQIQTEPESFYELCNANMPIRELIWLQLDKNFKINGPEAFLTYLPEKTKRGWKSDRFLETLEMEMKTNRPLYVIMFDVLMGSTDSPLVKLMREKSASDYVTEAYHRLRSYLPKKDKKTMHAEIAVLRDLSGKSSFEAKIRFLGYLPEGEYPLDKVRIEMTDKYVARTRVEKDPVLQRLAQSIRHVEKKRHKINENYYRNLRSEIGEKRQARLFELLSAETFEVQLPILCDTLAPYLTAMLQGRKIAAETVAAVAAAEASRAKELVPATASLEQIADKEILKFELGGRQIVLEVGLRPKGDVSELYLKELS